jgi:hypothetical protein
MYGVKVPDCLRVGDDFDTITQPLSVLQSEQEGGENHEDCSSIR